LRGPGKLAEGLENAGAPDKIRTCDLCLRRAKEWILLLLTPDGL
jgi:hypothetical protein